MTQRILIYLVLIWLLFLGVDYVNLLFEDYIASPGFGDYREHIFSTLRLWGFVIVVIYIFVNLMNPRRFGKSDLLFVGIFWTFLSFIYLVIHSHYRNSVPWITLFGDCDIRKGRIEGFILLTQLIGPYLIGTWRYSIIRRIDQDAG